MMEKVIDFIPAAFIFRRSAMQKMTKKQIEDYEQLCRNRNNGRLLTSPGLRFICEGNNCDGESINPSVGTSLRCWLSKTQNIDDVNLTVFLVVRFLFKKHIQITRKSS